MDLVPDGLKPLLIFGLFFPLDSEVHDGSKAGMIIDPIRVLSELGRILIDQIKVVVAVQKMDFSQPGNIVLNVFFRLVFIGSKVFSGGIPNFSARFSKKKPIG